MPEVYIFALEGEKPPKKIQHERMRQGNARIIVIHTFVFGLIIFLSLLVESDV